MAGVISCSHLISATPVKVRARPPLAFGSPMAARPSDPAPGRSLIPKLGEVAGRISRDVDRARRTSSPVEPPLGCAHICDSNQYPVTGSWSAGRTDESSSCAPGTNVDVSHLEDRSMAPVREGPTGSRHCCPMTGQPTTRHSGRAIGDLHRGLGRWVSGAGGTAARRSRCWRRCWRPGRAGRTWGRRRTAGCPRPQRRGTSSPGARRSGRAA